MGDTAKTLYNKGQLVYDKVTLTPSHCSHTLPARIHVVTMHHMLYGIPPGAHSHAPPMNCIYATV